MLWLIMRKMYGGDENSQNKKEKENTASEDFIREEQISCTKICQEKYPGKEKENEK